MSGLGGGGSTPESGSLVSAVAPIAGQNTMMANSTTKGMAGVRLSVKGSNHVNVSAQSGRKVLKTAMNHPRARPPTRAHGRLTSRPTAAAAMATTTRLKKSGATRVLNRGAINTPAMPANELDNAQANADTRSAWMPASSVMRGLSTTALMASPIAVNRNRAARNAAPERAITIWASSSRLNG